MNSKTPVKLLVMFALILALALSAAVPGTVQAQSDLVRLTIENKTSSIMYMWLTGPGIYYLRIPAGKTAVYTVERGEYNYKQYACGATTQSIVDLSTQQKLIMPICGGRAVTAGKAPGVVDLSGELKIVSFSLTNDSNTKLLAIFTGASTYVFQLDPDETKDYTIAKGDYNIQYYACGGIKNVSFQSYKGSKLSLDCP